MGRTIIRHSSNPRPGSMPYITGDGFRNLANHVYDATQRHVDVQQVKPRDIIFVGDSLIEDFLENIHPHISVPYVLITHNGDHVIDAPLLNLAGNKVLKWYGINVIVDDPKVVPIPLGIENKHYFVCGIPAVFNHVRAKKYQKKDKIFYGFTVSTNPSERQPALTVMQRHPLAETLSEWKNYFSYLHTLAHYKFTLSPPGSSVEGHRTWDALYTEVVPIVKRSITTSYFEEIGVPLLCVSDWNELDTVTEIELQEHYKTIRERGNKDTLTMKYWTDKIVNLTR